MKKRKTITIRGCYFFPDNKLFEHWDFISKRYPIKEMSIVGDDGADQYTAESFETFLSSPQPEKFDNLNCHCRLENNEGYFTLSWHPNFISFSISTIDDDKVLVLSHLFKERFHLFPSSINLWIKIIFFILLGFLINLVAFYLHSDFLKDTKNLFVPASIIFSFFLTDWLYEKFIEKRKLYRKKTPPFFSFTRDEVKGITKDVLLVLFGAVIAYIFKN